MLEISGIMWPAILCGFCGLIGVVLLTFGIIGVVFRKENFFKVITGISIVFLLVPVSCGILFSWSFYQDLRGGYAWEQEDADYAKKYPVSWRFENECEYGGNVEKLKELVKEYPDDINEKNEQGYTILDQLITGESYNPENLEILLDAGAKRSEMSLDTDGGSLFCVILYQSWVDDPEEIEKQYQCIQVLLDHGEDVNQKEKAYQNATPLMAASGYFDQEDESYVREDQKADPWTPSKKIIQCLLDAGADPKIKDDAGRTAQDYYDLNIKFQK